MRRGGQRAPAGGGAEAAMEAAFRLLGYRSRSCAEMRERLLRRGFAAEVVEGVIARLEELGYLDDAEFASSWTVGHSGWGPGRARHELRRKGLSAELVEEAVRTGFTGDRERAAAEAVARRALGKDTTPDRDRLDRIRRLLFRRGFSADVASAVCRGLAEGSEMDDPPSE